MWRSMSSPSMNLISEQLNGSWFWFKGKGKCLSLEYYVEQWQVRLGFAWSYWFCKTRSWEEGESYVKILKNWILAGTIVQWQSVCQACSLPWLQSLASKAQKEKKCIWGLNSLNNLSLRHVTFQKPNLWAVSVTTCVNDNLCKTSISNCSLNRQKDKLYFPH